jgi:SPX domain protein involved in polyphosphate accumulation
MTFRIEEKLYIAPDNKDLFLRYLKENNASKLFADRFISSIYFDNENLDMFKDSEEGTVPRKKIRLRNYDKKTHTSNKILYEIKTSSAEGRFKTSSITKLSEEYLRYGILDTQYGVCVPKLKVTYLRSYYKVKNFRLTVDLNIKYCLMSKLGASYIKKEDNYFATEIKTENMSSYNKILLTFPFLRARFSKYSRGILKFKL